METIYLGIVTGIVLGLASSLHCAAMCCGISTSLMFMFDTRKPGSRLRVLALAHGGRAISYTSLGALIGAAGAGVVGSLPSPLVFKLVQWAGAVALMWIGLSTAGLLPGFAVAGRFLTPVGAQLTRATRHLGTSPLAPLGAGVAWGLMPCPMVYGALLTAMLTGSALGGAAIMTGFAAATLPALGFASFTMKAAAANASDRWRVMTGVCIACAGFASVYLAPVIADILCR